MIKQFPYFLGNIPKQSDELLNVLDKYTEEPIANVSLANSDAIEKAISLATLASSPMRALSSFARKTILDKCVQGLMTRAEELSLVISQESGKPIKDAKTEVARAINTFQIAAEESTRILGEILPIDTTSRSESFIGQWKRIPIGPCLFITPFNFPLNLVAHKVAPAIAAGCPFILKPASITPISALILGEILADVGLPKGAFSILPTTVENAEIMVKDDRLKLLSFTGSDKVGWDLKSKSGKKRVILELGGNAACIVDQDQAQDLDSVVERLVFGAFYQSGQSCISVQRIIIHASIYNALKEKLIKKTEQLKSGNPLLSETFLGPLISEKDAIRIESWIEEAIKMGATLLCGGKRIGSIVDATLLEHVPSNAKLNYAEAFGPVAILESYSDFKEALHKANDTAYGLQAGVFTNDLRRAYQAWDVLEVGGVIINDVPSWRADNMPYGGVKSSGTGREGVRFAIEHLTEIRMMVINL